MPPVRGNSFGKPKNLKGTGKKMLKDFKPYYHLTVLIILFAIGSAILSLFSPILINDLLSEDTLLNIFFVDSSQVLGINWNIFIEKFGIILLIYVGSALLSWLSEFIAVSITNKYARQLREKVQRKLSRLPLSYFDKVPYGDTLSIAINDVDNISRNMTTIITQIFSSITLFIGAIIAMLVVRWELALVALCSLPFTIIVVLIISKFSGKKFESYRRELGELNGKIEENYAGYKIIKLFNKEEAVKEDFAITNQEMRKSDGISQFLSGAVFPFTNFINNLAYVAIAVTSGLLNDVAGMVSFFLFLNCFTRPFQQLGQIFSTIQSVFASAERIYDLLDEQETRKDPVNAINDEEAIKGNFSFENVYFQYTLDKPLIENFSLKVNAGDMVAIVGPTGAGKTTMVNLIMRFYEITNVRNDEELVEKTYGFITKIASTLNIEPPTKDEFSFDKSLPMDEKIRSSINFIYKYYYESLKQADPNLVKDKNIQDILNKTVNLIPNQINDGAIKLDGHSIDEYATNTLRAGIGMVLQDTWLFKGTIKENLLFGDQKATDEEIIKACKEAHIHHFIETLPGGYDFVLNEDGTNISQGQRQLLTIARAIISKPKILILDEATSSVDTRTEQQIQDALDTIMKNRTSFVIAHRLSTIKNAKLIIVMKKGHIVETGNHKELLAKGGFYADLYNSQFSGVNPMEKEEAVLDS